MEKTNFKKWGWWALGGVVAIVVVTMIVAAMGPADDLSDGKAPKDDEKPVVEDKDKTDGDKEADKKPAEDTEELPASGPVEDGMLGLLLAGVFAYIVGLGVNNVVRVAKQEK